MKEDIINSIIRRRNFFCTQVLDYLRKMFESREGSSPSYSLTRQSPIKKFIENHLNLASSLFFLDALEALEKGDPTYLTVFFEEFPSTLDSISKYDFSYSEDENPEKTDVRFQQKSSPMEQNTIFSAAEEKNDIALEIMKDIFQRTRLRLSQQLIATPNEFILPPEAVTAENDILQELSRLAQAPIPENLSRSSSSLSTILRTFNAESSGEENSSPRRRSIDISSQLIQKQIEKLLARYFSKIINLIKNEDGDTALHLAAKTKNLVFFKHLPLPLKELDTTKNNAGQSYADILLENGYFEEAFNGVSNFEELQALYFHIHHLTNKEEKQEDFLNLYASAHLRLCYKHSYDPQIFHKFPGNHDYLGNAVSIQDWRHQFNQTTSQETKEFFKKRCADRFTTLIEAISSHPIQGTKLLKILEKLSARYFPEIMSVSTLQEKINFFKKTIETLENSSPNTSSTNSPALFNPISLPSSSSLSATLRTTPAASYRKLPRKEAAPSSPEKISPRRNSYPQTTPQ